MKLIEDLLPFISHSLSFELTTSPPLGKTAPPAPSPALPPCQLNVARRPIEAPRADRN